MLTEIVSTPAPEPKPANSHLANAEPSPPEPAKECERCKLPGAPSHEPSRRCHYRPHIVNHCTCSACF